MQRMDSEASSSHAPHMPPIELHDRSPAHSKTTLQNFETEPTYLDSSSSRPRSRWANRIHQQSSRHPRISRVVKWFRGPRPKIDLPDPKPLLDIDLRIRNFHIVLPIESTFLRLTRLIPNNWLILVLGAAYIVSLAFFARAQYFLTPPDAFIGCTAAYWLGQNGCGLDGQNCAPFSAFGVPRSATGTILANPRAVGADRIAFVPLIVGGDSFICAAAIQASSGCATLDLVGNFTNFPVNVPATGLTSIGFPTVFPLSYRFRSSTSLRHCEDMRDPALAFNSIVTAILFLLLRPKPVVLFWSLVCIGYWHIVLFSQPRGPPPPLDTAFGTFLPALFIAYAFWRLAWRFTLPAFAKAPIEATIWYLGPFWIGIFANLTTDKLPLQRAITTLVIIVLLITAIAINQMRVFRKTGWLPHYLGWYILGGHVVLVLAKLPGLNLRIHHYILAMVLMPGTALPTRVSAICQGYLLGLFLNGAAAFGFDSILQTSADLQQDAALGTDLPTFLTNSTNFVASLPFANQTILWDAIPDGWDGVSLLVDDVERFVGNALNFSLAAFEPTLPHFFRLAFTSGGNTGDFTNAATLLSNGTWVDPLPGAT
ncbi:hypothetical protein C8J57DRAFT_1551991 [Mycena rebaudengoi]|nr:hypothetical protein C8J57DRAFT_1551991 [Mycena rebaudengoi]